ncbi:M48 family metalloprotease [Microvirga sp. W0021]|uniref:M48 family metalloprotease n=1 Tax=Hohaiivirga grylli TaxID=3133970 RepID=A0ABV0BKR9_9HYPH
MGILGISDFSDNSIVIIGKKQSGALLVGMVGVLKTTFKYGVSALVLCLLAACSTNGKISLPANTPRTLGAFSDSSRDHARLVAAFGGEYNYPPAKRMLENIVQRLVRASDRPDRSYKVTILNSPIANAFALPSGHLYVTRGLLSVANNSSEIAAVLSHEMAHVTLNHAEARTELQARSSLVQRVNTEVLSDPAAGRMVKTRSKVSLASFSRSQEIEADEVGIKTLAAAGFDPYGAAGFLANLSRSVNSTAKSKTSPDMLATHPSTADRIRRALTEAKKFSSPRAQGTDRSTYLSAINGIAFGDDPSDGIVRGRRFVHARFGVTFDAPEGFSLENTSRAVLGASSNGTYKLLFDAVESRSGQSLEDVLRNTWNETIETDSITNITINGLPAATASSRSAEWNFRLAAVQIGDTVFRLIIAAPTNTGDIDRVFNQSLGTLRQINSDEARRISPLHIKIVTARAGDTPESLASMMIVTDRPLERFAALNGISTSTALQAGAEYKIIAD